LRILILSDIHANIEALQAINEPYDHILCLGDLVDYGPSPKECIELIKNNSSAVVCGNHDYAVAFKADCKCSAAYKQMSVTTRELMWNILGEGEIAYLRTLPSNLVLKIGGARFLLAHASPTDNLYKYLPPDTPDDVWRKELEGVDADYVLLGHTHISMIKSIDGITIINPGSVGQSKDIPAVVSYAVWNDGEVEIKKVPYDINKTILKICSSPLDSDIKGSLIAVLEHGWLDNS